ncbi:MAG: recombinase family protein [Sphingomicrobium sp.]
MAHSRPDGYAYGDRIYQSLTQTARDITGTNWSGPRFFGLTGRGGLPVAKRVPQPPGARTTSRCASYTRKSTEAGLDQEFNSLDAQRAVCAAYVLGQRHEGGTLFPGVYDDGGFSGKNMDRPGLHRLLAEVQARRVDVIVVHKVDRLT